MIEKPKENWEIDGQPWEELLLETLRGAAERETTPSCSEKQPWPLLYHLHERRAQAVDWLPIQRGERVLELGSGCGALSGALLSLAGALDAVEKRERYNQINRLRHRERSLRLFSEDWRDYVARCQESYDWIVVSEERLIGPEDAGTLRRLLGPKGRLVLLLTNPYGLSYLAGCPQGYAGEYFAGITDRSYPSGEEWRAALSAAGFGRIMTYYPFPDHLFPDRIYSDLYLPSEGDLRNTDTRPVPVTRLRLFDEQRAWSRIVREGRFPLFANSYLFVAEAACSD